MRFGTLVKSQALGSHPRLVSCCNSYSLWAHNLMLLRIPWSSLDIRIVPYSTPSSALLQQYLNHRRGLGQKRGSLFLSESRRNYAEPISIWSWSKIVLQISKRAEVPRFTTHTLRHLCLTDLARAG